MATNDEENQTQEPEAVADTNNETTTATLKEKAPSSPSAEAEATQTASSKHKKTISREMIDQAAANTTDHLLKELAFARFIVRKPCILCLLTFAVMIILCVIMGGLFELTLQGSRQSFPDPPDSYVNDFDGYSLAAEHVTFSDEEEEEINTITQAEEFGYFHILMFFELANYAHDLDIDNPDATDYWILTPQNIKTIVKYEDKVFKNQEWNDRFCWVGEDPMETNYTCQFEADPLTYNFGMNDAIMSPARMIARHFDYDYDSFTTQEAKDWTLANLQMYAFSFNPGAFETGQTWIYRSFLKAGGPVGNGKFEWVNGTRVHLSDYENAEDEALTMEGGQAGDFYEWGFEELYNDIIIQHDGELTEDGMKIVVYSGALHTNYLFSALGNSVVFLLLAVLVVWGYMTYHLQSFFLSSGAMFGILMSFPAAYFVYRVLFQIPIFDTLSTLIVFVLLGVGADDVFVFTDAWSQSDHFIPLDDAEQEQREIKRMSFTYRRAANAMLVTQITTFFAFLATAASNLINMSAFGIWAACVVMMNYFIVITYYPAVLMLHHRYIKSCERKCLCCCCNKKGDKAANSLSDDDAPPKVTHQLSRQSSVADVAAELGKVEKFLGTKYAVWVIKFKHWILLFFLIVTILSAIGCANIKTATQTDNAFMEDHWWVRTQKALTKFTASDTDSLTPVKITFGIKGVDREGVEKYRPDEYYGSIVWQSDFDIASVEQQNYMKFICDDLRQESSIVYSGDSVVCPINDFEQYLNETTDYTFPFQVDEDDNPDGLTQSEAFAVQWKAFLDSPQGYQSKLDALTYVDADAKDIKYYAIWFHSTLVIEGFNIDGPVAEAFLDKLESYLAGIKKDCPQGMCDYVGNPNIMWVFLSIIKGYISSAVKGILIALPLAFLVMIFSTQNWVIALFALLDILGVMLTELAIMYLLGYEFSLTESIATVVIIGFSVDYVVHLANAYLESAAETRDQRLSFSLLTIGISVVSGAITTFLAGLFLVFAEFVFFKKMGAILMTTVLTSIVWAMAFFTALCATVGPQHETGDLKKYFRFCCRGCKKQQESEENLQSENQMTEIR